ncbi:MAG: hypothetical protein KDA28_17065, partial [Phycisphaerales bacterium]|nr:hypothetical protein [Phycisphaerales bacterium]
MNRTQRHLIPDSGNPKVDLVVSLAKLLEWEPEMVLNAIDPQPAPVEESDGRSYEEIKEAVLAARSAGEPVRMIEQARCLQN